MVQLSSQSALRLAVVLSAALLLVCCPVFGVDPSYTDCRPHIDATIRGLASKALSAGEEPTQPSPDSYTTGDDVPSLPATTEATPSPALQPDTPPLTATLKSPIKDKRKKPKKDNSEKNSDTLAEYENDIKKIKDLSSVLKDLEISLKEMKLEAIEKYETNEVGIRREKEIKKTMKPEPSVNNENILPKGINKDEKSHLKTLNTIKNKINTEEPTDKQSKEGRKLYQRNVKPNFNTGTEKQDASSISSGKILRDKFKSNIIDKPSKRSKGASIKIKSRENKDKKNLPTPNTVDLTTPDSTTEEIVHIPLSDTLPLPVEIPAPLHEFIAVPSHVNEALPPADNMPPSPPVVAIEPPPAAVEPDSPEPVVTEEPEPVVSPGQIPVTAPEPISVSDQVPDSASEPASVVSPEFAPVATPESIPVAVPEPVPVAAPEPVPVTAPESVPVVVSEQVPVSAPEPVPVAAPEPVPVVVSEQVPVPAPAPVAEDIPEPVLVQAHTQAPAAEPIPVTPKPKSEGVVNRFIYFIFGRIPNGERDPKWAVPWKTHSENIKPLSSNEPVPIVYEPGVFGKTINKLVTIIFGRLPDNERDPKWAQPWQTHEEQIKKFQAGDNAPKQKIAVPSGGILHKFICIFFGNPTHERDSKWAQPWKTHEEQLRKFRSIDEDIPKQKVAVPSGGILHKFISIFFGNPTHERDSKWAQHWHTHEEQIRKFQAIADNTPKQKVAVPSGGILHKFVSIFFGNPTLERDSRWAEPWQTHEEHLRKFKAVDDNAPKQKIAVPSGGILHKFVSIFFGNPTDERDSKWAQPWQTHEEQIRKFKAVDDNAPRQKIAVPSGGILHKFVTIFFGNPTHERDSKWAQPWQTHEEQIRKFKAVDDDAPRQKIAVPSGGILHKFVTIFFGNPTHERDSKWAEPWQTHEEQLSKFQKTSEATERKPVAIATGGIFDKVIRILFPAQLGERDPKFSQPWQTHAEHQKILSSTPETKKAVGPSGGILDKLIRGLFTVKDNIERDEKWAQPWQTHEGSRIGISPSHAIPAPPPVAAPAPPSVAAPAPPPVAAPAPPQVVAPAPPPVVAPAPPPVAAPAPPPVAAPASPPVLAPAPPPVVAPAPSPVVAPAPPPVAGPAPPPVAASAPPPVVAPAPPPVVAPAPPPVVTPALPSVAVPAPPPVAARAPPPVAVPAPPPVAAPAPPVVAAPAPPPVVVSAPPPATAPAPIIEEPKSVPVESIPVHVEPKLVQDESKQAAAEPKQIVEEPEPELIKPKPTVDETKPAVEESKPLPVEPKAAPVVPELAPEKPKPIPEPEEPIFPATKDSDVDTEEEVATASPTPPVADAPAPQQKEKLAATQDEEVEEQILLVPTAPRSRDHVESILGLDENSQDLSKRTDPISDETLKELKNIYGASIKPLEGTYNYQDISNRHMSDAEIFSPPMVLMLGPYSTGKSSFLNYLMGLEYTRRALKTGANPSLGVFRVIQYGSEDQELDGTALSADYTFQSLQKFGQNFVDQLRGNALNVPLLKKVTFVEAPGILEMRRSGERLYPFNDVLQWFIDRADLVLVMFDYTKLDAGYELEAVLDQLKGRESQVRILLNKADQIPPEELIKVQGSLFWNLSPLLGVSAPPTVYAGSFSSRPYRPSSPAKLFQAQEEALLHDVARAINSRVDNRVAIARRHAVRVRNHAQMVDTYLTTYNKNKGFLTSKHKLAEDIVENPHSYNIYEGMSLLTNISRYDLPDPDIYRDFFRVHNLYDFPTLKATCSYVHGCPLEQIDRVVSRDLPDLLSRYRKLLTKAGMPPLPLTGDLRDGARATMPPPQHSSKSL